MGCGTVEWNLLSEEVDQNREMEKQGRSGRRLINKQNVMQFVLKTLDNASRKVILLELGKLW